MSMSADVKKCKILHSYSPVGKLEKIIEPKTFIFIGIVGLDKNDNIVCLLQDMETGQLVRTFSHYLQMELIK